MIFQRLGNRHAAMIAAGAANGKDDLALALSNIQRIQEIQKADELLQQLLRLFKGKHIVLHFLIQAGFAAQRLHPVGSSFLSFSSIRSLAPATKSSILIPDNCPYSSILDTLK